MVMIKRVRVGSKYHFVPVAMDRCGSSPSPAMGVVPIGAEVKVVNQRGCPPANTMGMCYIEYQGEFVGMVCCNSLLKKDEYDEYLKQKETEEN